MIFIEKIRLDISSKSSAQQTIHMKCQAIFSLTNNKTNFRTSSGTILLSALRLITKIINAWCHLPLDT